MTPSQQTIQLIRDAIVSGNQQDAEKALEQYCVNFLKYNGDKVLEYVNWIKNQKQLEEDVEKVYSKDCEITAFELSSINKRYQLFNESNVNSHVEKG